MAENTDDVQVSTRVNQVYRSYLTKLFDVEYYRERHRETLRYARHFDFAIGVGTATSGGSGLSILVDTRLAWVCGFVTAAAVILSIAKNTYDWTGKINASMAAIDAHSKQCSGYRELFEDIQYRREWNDDFEERYNKLRLEDTSIPPFPYAHWSKDKLREVQNGIKSRYHYEKWWRFQR